VKLNELLGDPAWLFDLGFPIQPTNTRLAAAERLEWELGKENSLPAMSSLSGGKQFAEMSVAWSLDGLLFQLTLKQAAGKTPTLPSTSASAKTQLFTIYVDTRWSPGVHRATSFCHRFDFLLNRPSKSTPTLRGHGELTPIQRARAAPADIHPKDISVSTFFKPDGYQIKTFLNGETLTGYAPEEFQEIGIFYSITDSEWGNQIMARTLQSPFFEDPSVWCRGKLLQEASQK